jgi:hypothetical protein
LKLLERLGGQGVLDAQTVAIASRRPLSGVAIS